MAYDCGLSTIIAETDFGAVAAKFHCQKASCEECAPVRARQLIARGCQGKPNRFITLTALVRADQTPEEAYAALLKAFQETIRCARHRLNVSHEVRWKIPNGYKSLKRELQVIHYAKKDDAAGLTSINFFRTVERTQKGWPHIHLVARCPYIPQEWLSWQMAKRLKSPVVDIRAIHDLSRQVGYIVSYINKEEHRFGHSRRYAFSQKYELPPKTPYVPITPPGTRLIHHSVQLHTVLNGWVQQGHEIWKAGPRWHGWGEMIDAETGEVWPRPPNAEPWGADHAWDG